jgi:anti-anti-sigma regulatory factor
MVKKTKTINIDVAKNLAPIVGSRDVVSSLKTTIEKAYAKAINLDFSTVEFVSRSAAHELLVLKEKLNKSFLRKKIINFINASDNVTEMFRTVAANRALPKSKIEAVEIETIDVSYLSKLATS